MNISHTQQNNRGFALLLSIIIASVVLSIGISILKISVSQLQLSASGRESEVSFQTSQAITECLKYWYYKESYFRARPGGLNPGDRLSAPPFECMGDVPANSYAQVYRNSSSGPHLVQFHYVYEWGSDDQFCSTADLYVFVNPTDDTIDDPFSGTPAEFQDDVTEECGAYSPCAALVAQGYNRPCDQLETSIFTIQRELTSYY